MVQDHKVLMVQDHMILDLMVQDHIIGPKSHKNEDKHAWNATRRAKIGEAFCLSLFPRVRPAKTQIPPNHYKRQWYAFLFTDNHDVFFDKRMIWFSSLYC